MFRLFGKNDWYPVWAESVEWNLTWNIINSRTKQIVGERPENVKSLYEIVYSPSRNKYKLNLSGFDPKRSDTYSVAVKKLNEFIKNGHE